MEVRPVADASIANAGAGRWRIEGELGFKSVAGVLAKAKDLFAGDGNTEIDLKGVTRADSAGLALLVEWLREAERAGKSISFVNVPVQLLSIARISGLDEILSLS
jgi:phospholipid transport system transporter-binding protein